MNSSNLPTQSSQISISHHLVNSSTCSSTVDLNNSISPEQNQQHQDLQVTTNDLEKNCFAAKMEASSGHATNPTNATSAKSIDTNAIVNDFDHQSNLPTAVKEHGCADADALRTTTSVKDTPTSSSFTFNSFHVISKDGVINQQSQNICNNNNKELQQTAASSSFSESATNNKASQHLEITSDVTIKPTPNNAIHSEKITSATNTSSEISEDGNLHSNQDVSTSMESTSCVTVNSLKANAYSTNISHEMNADSNNISETISMQQSPPLTSAIQQKSIVDSTSPFINEDSFESNILVIDEPDSTTTATAPHTPPTTPENPVSLNTPVSDSCHNNTNISTTVLNSEIPSTSMGKAVESLKPTDFTKYLNSTSEFSSISNADKDNANRNNSSNHNSIHSSTNISCSEVLSTNHPLTPPTPTKFFSPPKRATSTNHQQFIDKNNEDNTWVNLQKFSVGDDVLIKRSDNRFYLGTIIEHMFRQYHVRFDDGSDIWCRPDEMRQLSPSSGCKASNSKIDNRQAQPMCIACKQTESDSQVEVCERCGRGYHRKCTIETSPGNGQWMCKRCVKPLKILHNHSNSNLERIMCLHLPYNYNSLKWDKKHRINEEQVYCYCGKRGKFDSNMLQCCRCLNWYHIGCTHSFAAHSKLLRGDAYFVFSCSVCNKGPEFIRRLLMNWTDLVHLVLYNLSLAKKHQQKFHSLERDILPFILENRHILSLPAEWTRLPKEKFRDNIFMTLSKNRDRFTSNRETKANNHCFGLRKIVPPRIPEIPVKCSDVLNNDFLKLTLKLQIASNCDQLLTTTRMPGNRVVQKNFLKASKSKTKSDKATALYNDVHKLHSNYIESDSSDDEVPIKLIKDKVKKKINELCTVDDNAIDAGHVERQRQGLPSEFASVLHEKESNLLKKNDNSIPLLEEKSSETVTSNDDYHVQLQSHTKSNEINLPLHNKKNSRKRKSFALGKIYNNARPIEETSSDENSSSSSPGTSLDLIIPPPKNFLGTNNPFRIVTPKKNSQKHSTSNTDCVGTNLKKTNNVFNTTAFDFAKKLSILKNGGIFPNLNTNHLMKTAGQTRTLRTIKRKLSAKDITIGPNQEVRRRRIRRSSSNIEVISTTTINTIPTNYIHIHAKDLLAAAAAATSNTSAANLFNIQKKSNNSTDSLAYHMKTVSQPPHGRRLRQRPQKISSDTSRSSSMSSNSSTSALTSFSTVVAANADGDPSVTSNQTNANDEDLKETVNKYFGINNRIESGEQFIIRAKRLLPNGEMQYLIEWSDTTSTSINSSHPVNPPTTASD